MEEQQAFSVPFPVERWVKLIERKMKHDYIMVVGSDNAGLFLRGRGYEPCPLRVAQLLVKNGVVTPVGVRDFGVQYKPVSGISGWIDHLLVRIEREEPEPVVPDEETLDAQEDAESDPAADDESTDQLEGAENRLTIDD